MAVLNVTPDSFFDGGRHQHRDAAKRRIDELLAEGADLIDIGAESTRPGSREVSPNEQIERAASAITHAVEMGALVSIDTTQASVAEAALQLGARVINDVSCLTDPRLAQLAVEYDADLIIMHSRGSMTEMDTFSSYNEHAYQDVVLEVCQEWDAARNRAQETGLASERIWFDPGLGFHKSAKHSQTLLNRLEETRVLQAALVIGASRKSFIGALDGSAAERRLGGTIAACLRAVDAGAQVLRVHDPHEVRQALLARRAFQHGLPVEGACYGLA